MHADKTREKIRENLSNLRHPRSIEKLPVNGIHQTRNYPAGDKCGRITTVMMENKPTLPGLWQTIAAGFDLTTKHLWLLLLPVILDTFFWLGPRFNMLALVQRSLSGTFPMAGMIGTNEEMLQLVSQFNVFTLLSVPFIGVPTLMSGLAPEQTPLVPLFWEVGSYTVWFLLFFGLTAVGLGLTAVYFGLVAQIIRVDRLNITQFAKRLGINWLQFLALAAALILVLCVIYIPILPISTILFLMNPSVGSLTASCGWVLLLWLVIYQAFLPQGIILNGRPLLRALIESVRLIQTHFVSALTLLFIIFVINRILDVILRLADSGTWFTGVSILGHAFISTSLVVATFIFYRDRTTNPNN